MSCRKFSLDIDSENRIERFFSEERHCNSKEYLFSRPALKISVSLAQVAELVDALDSKSSFLGSAGSIPALGTLTKSLDC
jgi:hypothetical protein